MNASDKRRTTNHATRLSNSTKKSNSSNGPGSIIAAPPRAQFIRPASASSPPVDPDTAHEANSSGSKETTAKEREKTLQDEIAALKRELVANEAEFTRTLDRLSQNESEAAGYWQSKHATLQQQFLRVDTELSLLRAEVDLRGAEKVELRDEWEQLHKELRERDNEVRSLQSQISGLKQWVSTSTKKSDQVSDDEFRDAMAKLRNGLQNWAVSHFRRCTIDLEKADQAIIDDLSELVPMYEELAASGAKAPFLQSIVSSVLVEMIFSQYFVGLPEEQAQQLGQVEKYMAQLSSTEAMNEWRAMTLTMLRHESASKMQEETDAVTAAVISRIDRILNGITGATSTEARDQGLRVLVANSINLARLLVGQKAMFKVTMPKILPYQRVTFEPETMEHIGVQDEDSLTPSEVRCVTFPGIIKDGDENGKHLQYRNVIAKATVLCSTE